MSLGLVAQRAAAKGWHVLPLHTVTDAGICSCGKAACSSAGKHPRIRRGLHAATTHPDRIQSWWSQWPAANIGLATGPSGLVVIDLDLAAGGEDDWAELVARYGHELERTVQVRTGGGGRHLYFRAPDGETVSSGVQVLGRGIDIRAQGGYVVLPPSRHVSGNHYAWIDASIPIAPLPDVLLALLRRARPVQPVSLDTIPQGRRNDTLFRQACVLRRRGWLADEIEAELAGMNGHCRPPLDEDEIRRIAMSACRYEPYDVSVASPAMIPSIPTGPPGRDLAFPGPDPSYSTDSLGRDRVPSGCRRSAPIPATNRSIPTNYGPAGNGTVAGEGFPGNGHRGGDDGFPENRHQGQGNGRTCDTQRVPGPYQTDSWMGDIPSLNGGGTDAASADAASGNGGGAATMVAAPGDGSHDTDTLPSINLTDLGNARRLVLRHGHDLRYCHAWHAWLIWNGRCWHRDEDGAVVRRAAETVGTMLTEAAGLPVGDEARERVKHALRSESAARIGAMIELARDLPGIPVKPEQLDADPWLLPCANGTLDLRDGSLRPHDRHDLLTRCLDVPYDSDAQAPRWHAFLARVMAGDDQMITYLQRAAGYSLTGLTGEEVLFLLHGPGRNGKSRFVGALQHVLGPYAHITRPETILARDRPAIPNDVAALAGARMVITTELEEGARLAESLVKQLTGGDAVSARFLHAEFFAFTPAFKLWIAANHKPRIYGTDAAIWERIHLIPFTVTIPKQERDQQLASKLQAEAAGILAWMVAGCLAWQREGLQPPEQVQAAVAAYRADSDPLAPFLAECVRAEEGARTPSRQLYACYLNWCEANGEKPWTQRILGMRLREQGFEPARVTGGVRCWEGLVLSDASDASDTKNHFSRNVMADCSHQ